MNAATRSVVYLGVLVGNILSGILGDTLGRRHAVLVCDPAPSQCMPQIEALRPSFFFVTFSSRLHGEMAMKISSPSCRIRLDAVWPPHSVQRKAGGWLASPFKPVWIQDRHGTRVRVSCGQPRAQASSHACSRESEWPSLAISCDFSMSKAFPWWLCSVWQVQECLGWSAYLHDSDLETLRRPEDSLRPRASGCSCRSASSSGWDLARDSPVLWRS